MPLDVADAPEQAVEAAAPAAQEYQPGELAPAIITSEKVWKPDDLKKQDSTLLNVLQSMAETVSVADEAARRFSVLQCWEARHMDRGYQYLEDNGAGGWRIFGTTPGSAKANQCVAADDANLYPTNILAAQGDIITQALNRGSIRVNFTPVKSKEPRDVSASDEANNYKHLWYEANNGQKVQSDIVDLGWTDPRCVAWTRTVADKSRFGTVEGAEDGEVKRVEVTTLHGVLESKAPMMADHLKQMSYMQLFEEIDYAVARASYWWMGDKIKPSWGTAGELEFERIARINTRIGIVGKLITGTSGIRETTMGYTWFRPGMFYDDKITKSQREFLLANFPKGLFLISAGREICCCWSESMDDHLSLGMYCRGFGQNRRSLGSSDIPVQKRINIWADLWDKTVRGAIPSTAVDSDAFNTEAIAEQEASPTRYVPVAVPEGRPMTDLFAQMPQAQLHPGMAEMFQWYVGPLMQAIDGGVPALFGEGEGEDNTVGATKLRLAQALERHGRAWLVTNQMFEEFVLQAAKLCGKNGNAEYQGNIDGIGDVTVNPQLLQGNFKCKSETVNAIPESGAQREAKIMMVLDMANNNPQVSSLVATPSNAREIVRGLHLDDVLTVDEANWEDGALEDIETLLDEAPLDNPAYAELKEQLEQATADHEQAKQMALASPTPPAPEEIDAGTQMAQQVEQLEQQLNQTPQWLPSVPVAQDTSQDHSTIAATVFSWMGEADGRALRRAAQKEQPGGKNWAKWTNVFLYWQGHDQMAQKLQKASGPPAKISMTGKLTSDQQAQLLGAAGIQTDPSTMNAPNEAETETIQRTDGFTEVKTRARRRL